jgi:hypothetical protein
MERVSTRFRLDGTEGYNDTNSSRRRFKPITGIDVYYAACNYLPTFAEVPGLWSDDGFCERVEDFLYSLEDNINLETFSAALDIWSGKSQVEHLVAIK